MIRSSLQRPAREAPEIAAPERVTPRLQSQTIRDGYGPGGQSAAQMGARGPVKSGSFLGAVFGFFGKIKKLVRTFVLGAAVAAAGFSAGAPLSGDAADVASMSKAAPTAVVVVQAGDSLSKIAQANGVPLKALIEANTQIEDPALIHPGQQVKLPTMHVVKSGDTMSQIAKDYGVPFTLLEKANKHIADPALIRPGQKIALPQADGASATEIAMTVGDLETSPQSVNYTTAPAPVAPVSDSSTPEPSTSVASEPYQAKGFVGKLIRQINKLSFGLLEDRDFDYAKDWGLGESGEARITLKGVTTDTMYYDSERYSYEAEQEKQGREVLWLRSEGSVAIEGQKERGESTLAGEAGVSFKMVRPFSYHPKQPAASYGAVEAFVENLYAMPFGHKAALALERGSGFELKANAEVSASGTVKLAQVDAGVEADVELRVRKLEGDRVEVRYERDWEIGTQLDFHELKEDTVDIDIDLSKSKRRSQTFHLDLSEEAGRSAYDALMAFHASKAAELAEESPAVELYRSDDEGSASLQAKLRNQPDADSDTTIRFAVERNEEEGEKSKEVSGGLDTRQTSSDGDAEVKFGISGERYRSDETSRDVVSGNAQTKLTLSERSELLLRSEARFETEENHERQTETRTGRIKHRGSIETERASDSDAPIALGFDANSHVDYRLNAPLGSNLDLPLVASAMHKAPEGTRFMLVGEGTLGASASQNPGRGSVRLEGEVHGMYEVNATRLEGEGVKVRLELLRSAEGEVNASWNKNDGDRRLSISTGHEREAEHKKEIAFELQFDQPGHRAAYNALMRGDMGPALAVTDEDTPAWVKSNNNETELAISGAPNEWLEAKIDLSHRDLDPTHSMIRWNSERKAFSDDAIAAGHTVRWVEVESALKPKAKYTHSVPVGGAATFRTGVSWEHILRSRTIAPSVDGQAPVLEPALTAAAAEKMARGAGFMLLGQGELSGFTGLGFGAEYEATGVQASLTASADTKHSKAKNWKLQADRLEDGLVKVTLDKGREVENAFELALRAGVKLDADVLFGLDPAEDSWEIMARLSDILEDEAAERLAVALEASWSTESETSERLVVQLDLSKPEARKAYEALVRLDGGPARLLADQEGSGVEISSTRTRAGESSRERVSVEAFGERLYLRDALREDTTVVDRWSGTEERTDTSIYEEEYEGLLGREQEMRWEAVLVRPAGDPVGKAYYRLQFEDEDPLTSKGEVRRLKALAKSLDAEPVREVKAQRGVKGIVKLLAHWGHHGETKSSMDLFFTQKGMNEIRKFDKQQALQLYGAEITDRFDGHRFGWADPVHGVKAGALITAFNQVDDTLTGQDAMEEKRSLEVEYYYLTGNEMWGDREPYAGAEAFADMVDRMNKNSNPVAWNKAFADLGQAVGFDFYDAVAAIRTMAGPEQVLVHKLEMKGDAVDIEMRDQGLIEHPA